MPARPEATMLPTAMIAIVQMLEDCDTDSTIADLAIASLQRGQMSVWSSHSDTPKLSEHFLQMVSVNFMFFFLSVKVLYILFLY